MNSSGNFIKIGAFCDSFQANMAREILQSNGIDCIVTGDEFRMFDVSSADSTPVQLIINADNQKKAEELIDIFFSVNQETDGFLSSQK